MPFDVEAIQVDGGSKFMAELKDACRQCGLKHHILRPKSPQMNGGVELMVAAGTGVGGIT